MKIDLDSRHTIIGSSLTKATDATKASEYNAFLLCLKIDGLKTI
jgi:hypothetical protein